MEGESGRNELLRGPFALFGVRSSAKLVRDLAKHRRTPMSPSAIDSAYFPGSGYRRDGRLRRRFSHTGHGPLRALIVSNLKWGGPCHGHYVFLAGRYQILHIFYKRRIEGISYFPHTVALSGLDKVRPPHLTRETLSGRRPADGADTPGGVFRSGENLPGEGDTADIFRRRRRE